MEILNKKKLSHLMKSCTSKDKLLMNIVFMKIEKINSLKLNREELNTLVPLTDTEVLNLQKQ